MKARKGAVLIRTLIGLATVSCGALGYAGYSTASDIGPHSHLVSDGTIHKSMNQEMVVDNLAADDNLAAGDYIDVSTNQEMVSDDLIADDNLAVNDYFDVSMNQEMVVDNLVADDNLISSDYVDAVPQLSLWTNAECTAAKQGNTLLIPFPQTLPTSKTICEGSMAESALMQSFVAEAQFTFTPNPEAIKDSPTYETDELSIWAGQPELGYFRDVEWGIVARIYDGNIYMFLQIGDGDCTVQFQQVPLHKVDGEFHTYSCALSSPGDGIIILECTVDEEPPVLISLDDINVVIPANYGLVAKSMRVSPESTVISAGLLVTRLEYAP